MKRILALLGLAVLSGVLLIAWKLQPWVPAGRAIRIDAFTLDSHEFQVWQRKNSSTFEPFATGLFVRDGTNDWRVFLLDFEDTYHPRVFLRREASGIAVFHGGDRLEVLDERVETFVRRSDGAALSAAAIGIEPPGDWWLR